MRVCSGAGCLRAVPDDVRLCSECSPTAPVGDDIREHSLSYDLLLDKLRKGTRWQKIRILVIKRCPLCARCELSISEIADHIVPAREAISQAQLSGRFPFDKYAGFYLMSNLQGLCRPCHYIKTLEDKTHVGPWPDIITIELAAPKRHFTF